MKGRTKLLPKVVTLLGLAAMLALSAFDSGQAAADEAKQDAPATAIVVDGSTTVGPIAKAYAEYFRTKSPDVRISVSESGSGNGATSLINGTCQVATMSRFMKTTEFKTAVERGVTPVAHVVAMDGIAVSLHPSNPVRSLRLAQVKAIFEGQIKNWKELGGPDAAIVRISRDTSSGTFETFNELVMGGAAMVAGTEFVNSNGQMHSRVSATPAAIGYLGIGYLDRRVKALPVDGVAPTEANIASGRYAIARPLYMFTNGYPTIGSPLHAFITLHLSRAGEDIIREVGFVPVTSYKE